MSKLFRFLLPPLSVVLMLTLVGCQEGNQEQAVPDGGDEKVATSVITLMWAQIANEAKTRLSEVIEEGKSQIADTSPAQLLDGGRARAALGNYIPVAEKALSKEIPELNSLEDLGSTIELVKNYQAIRVELSGRIEKLKALLNSVPTSAPSTRDSRQQEGEIGGEVDMLESEVKQGASKRQSEVELPKTEKEKYQERKSQSATLDADETLEGDVKVFLTKASLDTYSKGQDLVVGDILYTVEAKGLIEPEEPIKVPNVSEYVVVKSTPDNDLSKATDFLLLRQVVAP